MLTRRGALQAVLILFAAAVSACTTPYEKAYEKQQGSGVCPDPQWMRLYAPAGGGGSAAAGAGGSGNWTPTTPCEAAIVKAATDYCIKLTSRSDIYDNAANRIEDIGTGLIALAALGATVYGGVAGSTPAIISGTSLLFTQVGPDIGKITAGTPPSATLTQMNNAAQSYVAANQNLVVPAPEIDPSTGKPKPNPFYAGLWNAVGSACPSSLLAGGFHAESFRTAQSNVYWNQLTVTYVVRGGSDENTPALLAKNIANQLGAGSQLQATVRLDVKLDVTTDPANPVITVGPPQSTAGAAKCEARSSAGSAGSSTSTAGSSTSTTGSSASAAGPPTSTAGPTAVVQQVVLQATVTPSGKSGTGTGPELVSTAVPTSSCSVLTVSGGAPQSGDTITITVSWYSAPPPSQPKSAAS